MAYTTKKILLYRNYLNEFFIILLISLITGCYGPKTINILGLSRNDCVPDEILVEYVEQMRYLAMRDQTNEGDKKLKKIRIIEDKIANKRIVEAKVLLEKFRIEYDYGNCRKFDVNH